MYTHCEFVRVLCVCLYVFMFVRVSALCTHILLVCVCVRVCEREKVFLHTYKYILPRTQLANAKKKTLKKKIERQKNLLVYSHPMVPASSRVRGPLDCQF